MPTPTTVATGRRRASVELDIAGRTARGAAADVAWRFTNRSRPLRGTTLRWAGWLAFAGATALLVAFTLWSAAPMAGIYSVDDWAPGDAREFARVTGAVFAGLIAGLALLARAPRSGALLVAVSCAAVDRDELLMPCGRCRQLLYEHGGGSLVLMTQEGERTMDQVLPQAFGPEDLKHVTDAGNGAGR